MSVRKTFVKLLHKEMRKDERIVLILGDLGYGHFDHIREEFPNRVFNPGAAEQLMLGMACGMSSTARRTGIKPPLPPHTQCSPTS